MIYIGICDDEKIYQRNMETCCEHFFANKNISYRIVLFSSGEEVLTYQEHELLVLLLDIEMNTGMDGIRVMNLIRHNNYIRSIIFVSNYTDYVFDSFSPKTLGFCTKPLEENRFFCLMQHALDKQEQRKPIVFNHSPNGILYADDIIYIQASGHYLDVYTILSPKPILYVMDIKKAEQLLMDTNIIRIHKSYMVNFTYIQTISSTQVTVLPNKETLPIGRTYQSVVKNAHIHYQQSCLRSHFQK